MRTWKLDKYQIITEVAVKNSCPDEETLAAYLEGLLPETERSQTEEHLSACDLCLEELMDARPLVNGVYGLDSILAPSEVTHAAVNLVNLQSVNWYRSLWFKLNQRIRALHMRGLSPFYSVSSGGLQISTVRGNERTALIDVIHIHRNFKGLETDIEIEKVGERKAHIRIRLSDGHGNEKEVRITLKKGEREFFSSLLRDGYVLFEDLRFGRYSLTFTRNGITVGIYPFEIRETRCGRR